MTRKDWDLRFLNLARETSLWSKDPSTKVGAVIVRPDLTVASLGFNGFPKRMPDLPQYYADKEQKYSRVIHAEMNAILFAKEPLSGYTLYTTLLPCDRCLVHVAQAGIDRVVSPLAAPSVLERWGAAFDKTRAYAREMGLEIVEYCLDIPTLSVSG